MTSWYNERLARVKRPEERGGGGGHYVYSTVQYMYRVRKQNVAEQKYFTISLNMAAQALILGW